MPSTVFDELLAHPGVIEEVELRSRVGFLAFHGGSLERMTDVVAREAADRAGASYYGVIQPDDLRWHLPSKLVDPAHSPALAEFVAHVDVAIAIHGYGRPDGWTTILLGGQNRTLASHVASHLVPGLPEYHVVDDLDDVPVELRGLHPDNPVNRPRQAGVQVELPPRVRGIGPFWDRDDAEQPSNIEELPAPGTGSASKNRGLRPHTEALIDALASAARTWTETPTRTRR